MSDGNVIEKKYSKEGDKRIPGWNQAAFWKGVTEGSFICCPNKHRTLSSYNF